MSTESSKYGMNLLTLVALVTMFALNLAGVIENKGLEKEIDQLERNSLPEHFTAIGEDKEGFRCSKSAFAGADAVLEFTDPQGNVQQMYCQKL